MKYIHDNHKLYTNLSFTLEVILGGLLTEVAQTGWLFTAGWHSTGTAIFVDLAPLKNMTNIDEYFEFLKFYFQIFYSEISIHSLEIQEGLVNFH